MHQRILFLSLTLLVLACCTHLNESDYKALRVHLLKVLQSFNPKSPLAISYDNAMWILNPNYTPQDDGTIMLFNYYLLYLTATSMTLEQEQLPVPHRLTPKRRILASDILYLAKYRIFDQYRLDNAINEKSVVNLREVEEFNNVTLSSVKATVLRSLKEESLLTGMVKLLEEKSFEQSDTDWPFASIEILKRAWKWDLAHLFLLYAQMTEGIQGANK